MESSTRGRLLVASPDLEDPNFRRTVVLMLAHDGDGALGLVLNRPTEIALSDVLADWVDVSAPPACLYVGGPVQPEGVVGLGVDRTGDADRVVGEIGPVDLDAAPTLHADVRVFVGYSGWGPGQLDGELARGDWLVVDARPDDVVTTAPDSLWREVLRRQRGRVAIFAHAPEDASTN